MITLSIAAILLGGAIPSFTSIIASNRLAANANKLVTALNVARSEAIKRGMQVTIRRKGDTSTQWESGWDIFVDNDGSNAFNDDSDAILCEADEDCLLRTFEALSGGNTLRTGISAYQDYAAYLPSGLSKEAVTDTFTLCSDSGAAQPQRTITVNATGRPKVAEATGTCP